jgi:hypothetical protein
MTHEINEKAYSFELIENNIGIFDECCEATYIIYLEGSDRINNINNQLSQFTFTKKTYILHNKGYKNIYKHEYVNSTFTDLCHSYLTILKHSQNNKFKNFIIFEDDFEIDKNIIHYTYNINSFINKKTVEQENFLYYLGVVPNICKYYDEDNYFVVDGLTSHAIIYSEKICKEILTNIPEKTIFLDYKHWDLLLNKYNNIKRYMNKKCLCYQPFPITENMLNWSIDIKNITNIDFIDDFINNYKCFLLSISRKLCGTENYFNITYFNIKFI